MLILDDAIDKINDGNVICLCKDKFTHMFYTSCSKSKFFIYHIRYSKNKSIEPDFKDYPTISVDIKEKDETLKKLKNTIFEYVVNNGFDIYYKERTTL